MGKIVKPVLNSNQTQQLSGVFDEKPKSFQNELFVSRKGIQFHTKFIISQEIFVKMRNFASFFSQKST